nr:methionine--tRNA ligase subunit beta [Chitinophagales bacterium]
ARINNELVAIFGNFVNRTLVLTQNYFEGKVPPAHELNASDSECIAQLTLVRHHMAECIEQYKLRDALYELINLARTGNKYLADNEPWKVIAKDRARVETVLNTSLQVTAHLAMLSVPFLPESSNKIYTMLNIKPLKWDDVSGKNVLEAGHQLGLPSLLFKKIEDEEMDFQLKKLHYNTPAKVTTQDIKTIEDKKPMQAEVSYEQITYDEFAKLQLLVGTIETAEKVKKADKLLQMKINMGKESRTIVSGIAEHFSPEAIIGQQVCVVANLASRKIRGIESKGMILMAEDESGKLKFVMPSEKISDGSKIS